MSLYIHQNKKWPSFIWDIENVNLALSALHLKQGVLLGQIQSLGFQLSEDAFVQTLTEDILKSSEIEGEHLNKKQVRSSVVRKLGIEKAGLIASNRSIDGVVEMMLDATQKYSTELTKERLFGWHALLFPDGLSGLHKIKVAKWRDDSKGPMQVVSGGYRKEKIHFEAPPAKNLNKEMAVFLSWFNGDRKIDPVLKAAVAHFWFVTIHPFEDGNGRIARAIADMQLARADGSQRRFYSMSAQIQIDVKKYYTILELSQKSSLDITKWLIWFFDCLVKSFELTQINLDIIFKKTHFWDKLADQNLNARQRIAINKLLDHFTGKMTTSKWAKIAKCSQDTALRDISDLVHKNILRKESGGGRSTSYVLV